MKTHPLLFAAVLAAPAFAQQAAVEVRAVTIWSDGTKMAGDLYLPPQYKPGEKLPAIVFCNGTGGTKAGSPRQLGPLFAQAGYAFLGFDYRGWGKANRSSCSPGRCPRRMKKAK